MVMMHFPLLVAFVALLPGSTGVLLAGRDIEAFLRPNGKDDRPTECSPKYVPRLHTCKLGKTSNCSMSDMERGKSIMVLPGGKTRCISSPTYAFQVMPGRTDKLLLMFEGGGACWNKLSYQVNACNKKFIWSWPNDGVFRRAPENPFVDYTVVLVQYCSGDLHCGNVTNTWHGALGETVHQFGYHNTRATLAWTKANMDAKLESLVIAGTSAGAIGAQVWASTLLREFKYTRATVISDSYYGLFPDGFQGPVFNSLAVCDLDIIRPELKDLCRRGDITIPDVFEHAIKEFPNVAFASVASKFEEVQLNFFNEAAMSMGKPANTSLIGFYPRVRNTLDRQNRYPNFVSCLVPLRHHSFHMCSAFFDRPVGEGYTSLADWERQFVADTPHSRLRSVCLDGKNETAVTLCDKSAGLKEFVRPN